MLFRLEDIPFKIEGRLGQDEEVMCLFTHTPSGLSVVLGAAVIFGHYTPEEAASFKRYMEAIESIPESSHREVEDV